MWLFGDTHNCVLVLAAEYQSKGMKRHERGIFCCGELKNTTPVAVLHWLYKSLIKGTLSLLMPSTRMFVSGSVSL